MDLTKETFVRKFITSLMLGAALAIAGCATTTSGPTDPFLSMIIPSALSQNEAVLTDFATLECNAAAAEQYNQAMQICANPQVFVNALPPIPLSTITPATEIQAIAFVCGRDGYNNTLPMSVQPGPASVCVATPAGKAALAHFKHLHE